MFNHSILILVSTFIFSLLPNLFASAQTDSNAILTFDFNEQQIKEKDDKVKPTSSGVYLVDDRFGNEKSAIHTRGDASSYLSLSTSQLLKSPNMSISFWVKLDRRNYMGKGNDGNPMIRIKNSPGEDYINAVAIGYDPYSKHVGAGSTKDSTEETNVIDDEPFQFNRWYHYVVVCYNQYLALYADGVLKQKTIKHFETQFDPADSMLVGNSGSIKNQRMSIGSFDDIQIFHHALTASEVKTLYEAPNPNRFRSFLNTLLKSGLVVLALMLIIVLLLFRNKQALKKQKAQFELIHRISELELKVVKAQINPHFISNCLAAIQDLIYKKEIEKAGLYIAKFSFFIRQVLNYSDEDYICITHEMELISQYIELEQLRFKNQFEFKLEVDPKLTHEAFQMPALITQPFIENAIWHGLLPLENLRPAQLTVRAIVQNDTVVIEIEDNGVGRSSNMVMNKNSKGTKLVLSKIESLNRLAKANHYKIDIIDLKTANENIGTKVIIQLE